MMIKNLLRYTLLTFSLLSFGLFQNEGMASYGADCDEVAERYFKGSEKVYIPRCLNQLKKVCLQDNALMK